MSDYYTEQLVKRKTPGWTYLARGLMIAATVLLAVLTLMLPIAFIVLVLWCVAEYFLFRSMSVEYEYLYINGSLDVDKIMSRSKRKHVFDMTVAELEVLAPAGAPELRQYRNIRGVHYDSGNPDAKVYEMIVMKNGDKKKIIFEPNSVILEGMRMMAPRKVFL